LKRIILNIVIVIVICVIVIASILIMKNNKDRAVDTSQINSIESTTPAPTPTPLEQVIPSTQPDLQTIEPTKGEILFEKKIDLDNDNFDETVQIEKVKVEADNNEYQGVLKITGKEFTANAPFINKTEGSLTGVFTGVEFEDLEGDGIKDVFITIPDAGAEFSINYFFAYNYKKQKAYSYDFDNSDIAKNLIEGFKLGYGGNGVLTIKNDSFKFNANIDLKDNPGYSDSENLNKSAYDKAWVSSQSIDLDQNVKLVLTKTNKNLVEVKIPFIIFGQATSDILGEIDTYFSFNNDFEPILKRFEVHEFHGNEKNMVGNKILN
jgi:hypothetical protein